MSNEANMEILADRVNRMACGKCGKVLDVSELPSFSSINCPHCGTPQKVPAVLGTFLLAEQMGAGGMGAVYRAIDQALGRFVAIKVMKQQLGADTELVESFLREARAAAALNHPNIVQIYSCGQEKGQPYIVMELVAGGRLDQMMENGKKVDEVRLLQVALDVAEGLKAANNANLVHGDIKPANILFDQSGTAKVVDFGLAQFVNRQQEQGGIWGTPYYISPERARGGKADHRSDIYSLGATMYHALTGVPPFDGKTATDVVVARLKAPPCKIRDLEPALSLRTAQVVERMMAADPVLRYPTSASLLADLKAALAAAKEERSATGRSKKHPKRERGHLVVVAVALLVMVGLVVAALWWSHRRPPPSPTVTLPPITSSNVIPAESKSGEPPAAVTEDDKQKAATLFFSDALEVSLVQALSGLTSGPPSAVYEALETFSTNVPKNSARLMWVRVLQAVPNWLAGEDARADQALRAVAAQPIQQPRGHAMYMPQVLATYLIGDLNDQRLEREYAKARWPSWYMDLVGGLKGFKALKSGDLTGAEAALNKYLSRGGPDPAWAYALRPGAQALVAQLGAWEQERQRLLKVVEGGDLEAARAAVEKTQAGSPPFTKSAWETVREAIRKVEAKRAEEIKEQEKARRQVIVQQDIAVVQAFLATNTHFTGAAKEYRKVVPLLLKLQADLPTPEGKEYVNTVREQLDRMDGLKALLIKEMAATPFKAQDLGVEAVGANVLGVRFAVPGRGTLLRNWDQINPNLMLRLTKFYLEQPGRAASEVADYYLSLAIYCVYNSGPEVAAGLLKQALERDPAVAEKMRRLLPEIKPAE